MLRFKCLRVATKAISQKFSIALFSKRDWCFFLFLLKKLLYGSREDKGSIYVQQQKKVNRKDSQKVYSENSIYEHLGVVSKVLENDEMFGKPIFDSYLKRCLTHASHQKVFGN